MDYRRDCLWTEQDALDNLPCIIEKGADEKTCVAKNGKLECPFLRRLVVRGQSI